MHMPHVMFDLHMHSTFSDGSESVESLIRHAREQGLAGIAITDHDSLTQLASVRNTTRELGFPVLAGVEVSTFDAASGRKAHILAYGLSATESGDSKLERILATTLQLRTANTLWQAWTIIRNDISFYGRGLALDDAMQVGSASTSVYKQHIMEALTGLPYNDPEYQRVYRLLFKDGGIAQISFPYPDTCEVICAIRELGGHPVLAHAGQMDNWSAVPQFVEAGLEGIEVHHPDHGDAEVAQALELAERFGLMRTGGSDYHGKFGGPANVGCVTISADEAGEAVLSLFDEEPK